MTQAPVIVWFRQDLRLKDNAALHHAAGLGPVIPVFIHDEESGGGWTPGAASKVWLHHSLAALNGSLKDHLVFLKGSSADVLSKLVKETGAAGVYWNKCYEPWQQALEKDVSDKLSKADVDYEGFKGHLLIEPWDNVKDDGTPYRVFTPFKNKFYQYHNSGRALPVPKDMSFSTAAKGVTLESLKLLPAKPRWDTKIEGYWTFGEDGAQTRLAEFLDEALPDYNTGRDRPDRPHISRLSPFLHFGEISVRQVWNTVSQRMMADHAEQSGSKYLSELAWREFSAHLLHHFPHFPDKPYQARFADFEWGRSNKTLQSWQKGVTGYPIVDAGMRELWETGFMHNRVRMIVASFLIKDLLVPWQDGEKWFWDCLVDADLANNSCSWQWVAGSGADAAPYFRVFNPTGQGQKFDPDGAYVRQWVPELAHMPAKYIHEPSTAPDNVLDDAGVVLGQNYPYPVVNHAEARIEALDRFKKLKAV